MHSEPPQHRPAPIEDGPEKMLTQSTPVTICLNITHSLTQFCLGGVVICALIIPIFFHEILITPLLQHIVLCTVGFFFLMTQAILTFSPFGFARNLKYDNKKMIHAMMQTAGSALVIAGGSIQLANRNYNSAHGFCGILSLALTIATLIGGVVNFIISRKGRNKCVTVLHSLLGTLTIIFAFVTVMLAFDYYYRFLGDVYANLSIVLSAFALVGTIITAFATNVKRILDN